MAPLIVFGGGKWASSAKFPGSPAIVFFLVEGHLFIATFLNSVYWMTYMSTRCKIKMSEPKPKTAPVRHRKFVIFSKICMMAGAGGPQTAGGRLSCLLLLLWVVQSLTWLFVVGIGFDLVSCFLDMLCTQLRIEHVIFVRLQNVWEHTPWMYTHQKLI